MSEHPAGAGGMTRRGFLAAGVASAALVGVGGIGAVSGQTETPFVRPPGAGGAIDMAATCNRCGKCFQACPYGIVSAIPLSQSVIACGTPQLVFEHGACDFCMKCVDACPTGALSRGVEAERDCGVAVVASDACVAWNWMGCTLCHDECPVEGAITLDADNRPVVHADACDGCGACENACPSASVRAYDADAASKGIVVVPRASQVAVDAFGTGVEGSALSGDAIEAGRHVVAAGGGLPMHTKGIHPAGPDASCDANGVIVGGKEA